MKILTSLKDNLTQRFILKTKKNDEEEEEEEEPRDGRRRIQNKIDMSPSLSQFCLGGSIKNSKNVM